MITYSQQKLTIMRKLFLLLPLLLLAMFSFAQQKSLTGTVVNKNTNEPLAGVTVQGKNAMAVTDANGKFTIKVADGESLSFSFVGMNSIQVKVDKTSQNLKLALVPGENNLEQVVITGYTSEKKKDMIGAVTVVNVSEVKDIPQGNVMKSLAGRVPGLNISQDGSPNGAVGVMMRGITTLNSNNPLYIIDGIPTERGLQEINQNDIESIQVLRDASAASIYGSRAAAGVIIITTKTGKKGKTRIDFDASTSLQYFNSLPPTLNTVDHGKAYWQAAVNDGQDPNLNGIYTYTWNNNFTSPSLSAVNIPKYVDAAQTMLSANTNWYKEISQTSFLQAYNLSMSSGGERGSYLFSIGFFDNNGIIKTTNDTKVTARFNSDFNFFNGRLKVGENLSVTYMNDVLLPVTPINGLPGYTGGSGLFQLAQISNPIIPVHTVTGGWGGPVAGMDDRQNPVRLIYDFNQNHNNFGRVFGNTYIDLAILHNLHFRSSVGVDLAGNYARLLQKPYVSGFLSSPITSAYQTADYEGTFSWHNTLTYDLNYKKNRFNFLLGEEQVKDANQNFNGYGQGLALADINYAYLSSTTSNILVAGGGSGDALLSYFGKINYSYDGKYLASVTLRDDGSSKFGVNNQWGQFPAFSLGWRASQEDFVRKALPIFSDLKLRYGWGQTGNQNIANNATQTLYQSIYGTDITWNFNQGTAYNISGSGTGTMPSGYTPIQQGNPNLKWETTTQSNIGIDFGLLNNKVFGSLDYFTKTTTDILIQPPYLAVLGQGGGTWYNGAKMRNKGFEGIVTYNAKVGKDLSLTFTGNVATYQNKVLYLPSSVLTAYAGNGTTQTVLGRSINSLYGYDVQGIFQNQAEVNSAPTQPGDGVGRIRYKDLNHDGVIDANDQRFLGKTDPDFTYGLNTSISYKNFDLSFFFQGIKGGLEYNNYKYLSDFTSLAPGSNWGPRTLQAWTPTNTKSTIPALTLTNANNEGRYSSYFLEKASYLKLRNIQLAYNLKNISSFKKMQRAKIYIQASNLLRFKNKSNPIADPENPADAYPIPVVITGGINLSF